MLLSSGLLLLAFSISIYAASVRQPDLVKEKDNRTDALSVQASGRRWRHGSSWDYHKSSLRSNDSDVEESNEKDDTKWDKESDIPWKDNVNWDFGDYTTFSSDSFNTSEVENDHTKWFDSNLAVDWFGFLVSKAGMNSANFHKYTFNVVFANHYNTKSEYTPSSAAAHLQLKEKLWELEQLALTSQLTTQNLSDWQPFATALASAFVDEYAAMSYDPDRNLWIVCGFISLSDTFIVPNNVVAHMCASACSIGLESPVRDPVLGEDYILQSDPSRMISAHARSSSTEKKNESQGKGIVVKVIYVDLTDSNDAKMASCIEETGHQSCTSFCCASEYKDATFCGGLAMDTCL